MHVLIARRVCALVAIFVCGAAPAGRVAAQITPGRVTEEIVSASDASQRYALFVPRAYRPDRQWPVAILMDPRGRALEPLDRMRAVADRLGYVLISSYNTSSDGELEPNARAVEAMIEDVQSLVAVDGRRLYFVGFSGTARLAWLFAGRLAEHTAGVIGFGAGLPSSTFLMTLPFDTGAPFAFFGGAGDVDFNYEEVRALDAALEAHALPHRLRFYPGPHAWPGPDVFADALDWMDVQAVRNGVITLPTEAIAARLRVRMDDAAALEASGDVEAAVRAYRSVVADFDGLIPVAEATERLAALAASDPYRAALVALDRRLEDRRRFDQEFDAFLARTRESPEPDIIDRGERALGIADLLRRADSVDDPDDAKSARRMLSSVFVHASFYEPADLLADGRFEAALAFFRLADTIEPGSPQVCLGRARAYAGLGARDQAFDALACVVDAGGAIRALLERDPLLEPLRTDPRFAEILRRLGA